MWKAKVQKQDQEFLKCNSFQHYKNGRENNFVFKLFFTTVIRKKETAVVTKIPDVDAGPGWTPSGSPVSIPPRSLPLAMPPTATRGQPRAAGGVPLTRGEIAL